MTGPLAARRPWPAFPLPPRLRPLGLALILALILPAPAGAQDDMHLDALTLMDIVRAGPDLVAVGERGTVLRAAAADLHWQRLGTPTTRTLTGIAFATPQLGMAVGHGGALLRSEDGGHSWQAVTPAGLNGESLLGVAATGQSGFAAFGAFGLLLTSEDGGRNWSRHTVLGPDFDRHLYALKAIDAGHWLLAGESGTLALSQDRGQSWRAVQAPYEGSLFGVVQTGSGALLAFGMRGHVLRSVDRGESWTLVPTATTIGFNGGQVLADGTVVLAGNGGMVAISGDDGLSFHLIKASTPTGLAQIAGLAPGQIIAVGEAGLTRITVDGPSAGSTR